MKKTILLLVIFLVFSGCSDAPEDPYLSLDPNFKLETFSFVVPDTYELFLDRNRTWGAPFFMSRLALKEGGNSAEMEVQFTGGCARHRFSLYAESIYDDRTDPDTPLDITLYVYHGHEREDCVSSQTHTFRNIDLSFLTPGLYNITIENTSNRNQYFYPGYAIK